MGIEATPQYRAGAGTVIEPRCLVGWPYPGWKEPAELGAGCRIRLGSIIYADTVLGDRTMTGARAFVREHTHMGARCLIGTDAIIEGHCEFGDDVLLQSGVFIPTHTRIGDRVFVGPHAVLTNDRYPLRRRASYEPLGPVLGNDVTVGANATILPGVRLEEGAMVAAGAVVTADVPAWTLATGVPARIRPLPEDLRTPNETPRRP